MIRALHHRGPDGRGFHVDGAIGLAHARLSIIDLAGGWQPMHNEDASVWVVFNGEIFNYLELRQDLLARGHRFASACDTEVIVHLYEEHGDDFVHHLNGQFAIALWDARRRRLVLARDRTGIRPLYYTRHRGRLLFGSEAKALFAVPGVARRFDAVGLAQAFTYWAPLAPRSAFEGIHQLPPGSVLALHEAALAGWDGAQPLPSRRYWDWSFDDVAAQIDSGLADTRSADDWADELRALLIDCVRLQLRADVPVGAYLSGGLDSSVITSVIRHFTDTPLRTFSVTFDDAEFDESAYQQELVRYLGTDHTALRVRRSDIAAAFLRAVWHGETPIVRTAPAPLMMLAARVRAADYKVVLTGEGADEVFGGYDLFKEARIRRFLARQPQSAWRGRLLDRIYPWMPNAPGTHRAFAQRFFADGLEHLHEPWFGHTTRWASTQRVFQFFAPELRQRLAGWSAFDEMREVLPPAVARWPALGRDQYIEAHTLLSGYLLSSQGDRVAMAHSVEGRVPFLDHRLIEFANRLPPRYKLMGLTEKYLLKRAMAPWLPEAIHRRPKQPYRAPESSAFFVDGRPLPWVADVLSADNLRAAGCFDPVAVGKLMAKCAAGRAIGFPDNMAFVGVLSTMLLHEQYVRPATWAPPPVPATPIHVAA